MAQPAQILRMLQRAAWRRSVRHSTYPTDKTAVMRAEMEDAVSFENGRAERLSGVLPGANHGFETAVLEGDRRGRDRRFLSVAARRDQLTRARGALAGSTLPKQPVTRVYISIGPRSGSVPSKCAWQPVGNVSP